MENYIIANRTDVGQTRQVNEDSMITFDSPNGRVVAVCDGMGGQAAGDVASQLACNIIRDILENNTFPNPFEAITRSIMAANQGILHRASQNPQLEGMGSTCVMLIIKDGLVTYGWVGDSRIYYISNHTIRQISRDQSYVQTLVDSGKITEEEAKNHPQKNEIINALGLEGMTPPILCQNPIKPEPGSVFLLCSDGLSGMVDNAHIEHIVSKSGVSLQEKANQLVSLANQNGGLDNITVQLVQFEVTEEKHLEKPVSGNSGANKKKRLIMMIVGILIVLAIGIGAYVMFSGKDSGVKKQTNSSSVEDNRNKKSVNNGITNQTFVKKGNTVKVVEKGKKTPKGSKDALEKELGKRPRSLPSSPKPDVNPNTKNEEGPKQAKPTPKEIEDK